MSRLRAGGAEGEGGQMLGLRGGGEPPKQEKAEKDLRGEGEGVESRCQQLQPKSKMKLNQLSIGTVFFFIGETTTAFKLTKTGVTNMVTKNRMTFKRFPGIANMEVAGA